MRGQLTIRKWRIILMLGLIAVIAPPLGLSCDGAEKGTEQMWKVYLVSYDLRVKPKPHYTGLYAQLKRSPGWFPLLESSWLIATAETADQLRTRIGRHLYVNDYTFITEITDNFSGWLPQKAWAWIYQVVPAYRRLRA